KYAGEGGDEREEMPIVPAAAPAEGGEKGEDLREKALTYFMRTFGGDEESARHLLRSSIDSVRSEVRAIESALESGNGGDLQRALHSLKGILLNSGLTEQGERAAELNTMAEKGTDPARMKTGAEALVGLLRCYCDE
ncbi:MAG: Hpt domain-containing protein, partial [Nitrospirales bacterium]|nr:Hpt domain-containing protein [Nitrospirales bacterium]